MRGGNPWFGPQGGWKRHGFGGPRGPWFLLPAVFFAVFIAIGRGRGPFRFMPGMPPVFFWLFGAAALAGVGIGIWTLLRSRSAHTPRAARRQSIDKTLVQIARANHGRIRVGDLVEHSNLTLEAARKKLDRYAKNGDLTLDYDDLGNVFFRLPEEPNPQR